MTPPREKDRLVGNAQFFGENGELVGFAVAIGVFANDNAIVSSGPAFLQFVGIVVGQPDPKPAAFVPVHEDRFAAAKIGFRSEQLHSEAFGRHHVLDGFFRRKRLLHHVEGLALHAPSSAPRRVVRNLLADVDVFERLDVFAQRRHFRRREGFLKWADGNRSRIVRNDGRIASGRPTNASFD